MPCTRPLNGWMSPNGGQWRTTPNPGDVPSQVPCGRCMGCRLNRSRGWAVRGQCEAALYESNCFITLTYSDENLHYTPSGLPNLHRRDITLFLKRLRKTGAKFRYFGCGEYGSKFQRPHYHLVLFNHDFHDKVLFRAGQFPLYVSDTLQRLWPHGHSVVAGVSFESIAYTARYCCKKVNGAQADEHYQDREPEMLFCSRRPGIAYDWFIKYYDDVVNFDKIISRGGRAVQPPRVFDKWLSGCDYELLLRNKERRIELAKFVDPWRLSDLDRFNDIKFKQMMRSYENG
jgi:hypothetical protein